VDEAGGRQRETEIEREIVELFNKVEIKIDIWWIHFVHGVVRFVINTPP
jgi:hypothetical protein